MGVARQQWHDLPEEVHAAVEAHTGPVITTAPAAGGRNSAIAATVHGAHVRENALDVFAWVQSRLCVGIAEVTGTPDPVEQLDGYAQRQGFARTSHGVTRRPAPARTRNTTGELPDQKTEPTPWRIGVDHDIRGAPEELPVC